MSPKRIPRRGISTLWLLMWLPALIALFAMLLGVSNLWLARVEAETALEAAALAAVEKWVDSGGMDTLDARQQAVSYAAANQVRGKPVIIDDNYQLGPANQNQTGVVTQTPPGGNLIFGSITSVSPVVFDANALPTTRFAVRAEAIIEADKLGSSLLYATTGYCVRVKATAMFDTATGRATLIRVDQFIGP
jgi:Flp pilus assembly protein TadG